jgi:hypothetical protein
VQKQNVVHQNNSKKAVKKLAKNVFWQQQQKI